MNKNVIWTLLWAALCVFSAMVFIGNIRMIGTPGEAGSDMEAAAIFGLGSALVAIISGVKTRNLMRRAPRAIPVEA